MNRELSSAAVLAFVTGCTGMFLSRVHAIFPKVVAVPLGPVAIVAAIIAAWRISAKRGTLRGGKLALWGGTLGLVGSVLGGFAPRVAPGAKRSINGVNNRRNNIRGWCGTIPPRAATSRISPRTCPSSFCTETRSSLRSKRRPDASSVFRRWHRQTRRSRAQTHTGRPDHDPPARQQLTPIPKHSYTFHTLDAKTNELKVDLFGFPKDDAWVLYAPFEDKTMIRDVLAYQLSNKMGEYTPRTRYVEVFVRSSGGPVSMKDYEGVYVLVEKIKRGKERVNIAKLTPEQNSEPEISGGYIIKRDHQDGNGKRFHTDRGGPYFFVNPNERTITREQRAWLTKYFTQFEEALYGDDFADPKKGYAAYLDTAAFIDQHWLIEMSKNVDGFRYSAFLTKDRNGKLKAGPGLGLEPLVRQRELPRRLPNTGLVLARPSAQRDFLVFAFAPGSRVRREMQSPLARIAQRVFDPVKINATIDQLAAQLEESQQRNFQRWPILGQQVTCNHFVGNSYEEEVNWLKSWITHRIAWIDKQVAQGGAEEDQRNSSE